MLLVATDKARASMQKDEWRKELRRKGAAEGI